MSKVYFSRTITPEKVVELYKMLGADLPGKVAVKVHSGEKGNQNFLRPEFWKPVIDEVGGTAVECNTAYEGSREFTKDHLQTLKDHGWTDLVPTDILDSDDQLELAIPKGEKIKKNFVPFAGSRKMR